MQQLQHQQALVRDVLALGLANLHADAAVARQPVPDTPLTSLVGIVLSLLSGAPCPGALYAAADNSAFNQ